jgi:hypothetical protein
LCRHRLSGLMTEYLKNWLREHWWTDEWPGAQG